MKNYYRNFSVKVEEKNYIRELSSDTGLTQIDIIRAGLQMFVGAYAPGRQAPYGDNFLASIEEQLNGHDGGRVDGAN